MSRLAKHAALTEVRSCPGDQRRTDLALFVLHAVAIATFTRGFLLTRVELPNTSGCSDADGFAGSHIDTGLPNSLHSCWSEVAFPKVVVLVIDALRWDFVASSKGT
eukprot:5407062-Pyramimonas_sp.AAC.2